MKTNNHFRKNSQEKTNKNSYLVIVIGDTTIHIPSSAFPHMVMALAILGIVLAIIGMVTVVFLFTGDPSVASIK